MDRPNNFPHEMIKLLTTLNSVSIEDALKRGCKPFLVDGKQVGLIRSDFFNHLKAYTRVFVTVEGKHNSDNQTGLTPGLHLSADLKTCQERTQAVQGVLEDLRDKDAIAALRGWRHENYKVSQKFTDESLLDVERAASGLFGFIQYGVHVNGFTRNEHGDIMMWIGRRSKTKQTFPNMYDNMCAGGLAVDMGILECTRKECQEEASVSDELLKGLKFVGNISYFYEDERGLFPECQYVFDLELPSDFQPVNADGEVATFHKFPLDHVKTLMTGGNFKPNCVAVCLDFMIRHSFLDPDQDPNISFYIEQLHAPIQSVYAGQ